MKTIAHISDLHFGRIDAAAVQGLLDDLAARAPSLVVISGDIVQRAGHRHFRAARAFLDRLTQPVLIVPGNHDIPAYDLIARFVAPFRRYRHYITQDLCPVHIDGELAVLGLNSARALNFNFAHGRINRAQMERVREVFAPLPPHMFKVLVVHHPLLPPPDAPATRLIGRVQMAVPTLAQCGVDLVLSGHLHRSYTGDLAEHHPLVERSVLVGQASTTTSTRLRNEPNSYSFITIAPPVVRFQARVWNGTAFAAGEVDSYRKNGYRWDSLSTGLTEADAAHG